MEPKPSSRLAQIAEILGGLHYPCRLLRLSRNVQPKVAGGQWQQNLEGEPLKAAGFFVGTRVTFVPNYKAEQDPTALAIIAWQPRIGWHKCPSALAA